MGHTKQSHKSKYSLTSGLRTRLGKNVLQYIYVQQTKTGLHVLSSNWKRCSTQEVYGECKWKVSVNGKQSRVATNNGLLHVKCY